MKKETSRNPRKIYLELTTRCNLQCRMCVKHMEGSCIAEDDMEFSVFKKILPSLNHTKTLILNGIGEPLMHPDLVDIIRQASSRMAKDATIGFQSNGLLLDKQLARDVVDAGLTSLCFSVDALEEEVERGLQLNTVPEKREHSFDAVSRAVSNLDWARKSSGKDLKIGLETVLTKDNIDDLPQLVSWAAAKEVDYILTTHLIIYDQSSEQSSLFNPNTDAAIQLFDTYNQRAIAQGLNLDDGFAAYQRYAGTQTDSATLQVLTEMNKVARDKDIRLNLSGLLAHHNPDSKAIESCLEQARRIAEENGIDLFLPPLQANDQRSCRFMADEATFISPNGDVMPCHFLWHSYPCRVLNEEIQVQKRVFGNILEQPLTEIWQSDRYAAFRNEAKQHDYSPCWNCSQGPCADLVNNDSDFANDCFGSQVPCGHCQWNLGAIRCL